MVVVIDGNHCAKFTLAIHLTNLNQKLHCSQLVVANRITQGRVVVDVHGVDVNVVVLGEASCDVEVSHCGCKVQGGALVVVEGLWITVAGDNRIHL